MLVGISLTLSYGKVKDQLTKKEIQFKFLKRGLKIFGLGLFITLISFIVLREGFIIFGVLHCIGLSILFSYPFLKFQYTNLMLGLTFIILGLILKGFSFDFYWLFWLGFTPSTLYTIDYYPILPWLGVILIGIFIGKTLYLNNKRNYKIINLTNNSYVKLFTYLGKRSLIIYFIHQPILLSIIYLYTLI
jgi:uncharacterized membrane protein